MMAIPPIPNGTEYHRLVVPSVMLCQQPDIQVFHVKDLIYVPLKMMQEMDVIIVSRLISLFPMYEARVIEKLEQCDAKLIVDIDDHWILPKGHPGYALWKESDTGSHMQIALHRADAVWCTTEKILRNCRNVTSADCYLVENGISKYDEQWKGVEQKRPWPELMIGVSVMPNHWPDIEKLRKPLQALRKQRGWRLVGMGSFPKYREHVQKILGTDRIRFLDTEKPHEYASVYQDIDLLICPLQHSEYNKYRSDIKLAEAVFSNTPVMLEDFGPYKGHPFSVRSWDKLVGVVTDYLTTNRNVLDDYRMDADAKDWRSTDEPDAVRLESIRKLVA